MSGDVAMALSDHLVKRGAKPACREIDRSSCRTGKPLASPVPGFPHARSTADHLIYNPLAALTLRRRRS